MGTLIRSGLTLSVINVFYFHIITNIFGQCVIWQNDRLVSATPSGPNNIWVCYVGQHFTLSI